jgi:hypothetical protein
LASVSGGVSVYGGASVWASDAAWAWVSVSDASASVSDAVSGWAGVALV